MRLVPIQPKDGANSEKNMKSAIVIVLLLSYLVSLAIYTSRLQVDTGHMTMGVDMDVALLPLLFPNTDNGNNHHRSLHAKEDLMDWMPHIQLRQHYVQSVLEKVPMDVQNKSVRFPGGKGATICKEKVAQFGANITILDELLEFSGVEDVTATTNMTKSTRPKDLSGTKHAIVIPFRDRDFHLQQFQKYMSSYLQHHYDKTNHTFKLYILDQDDAEPFQRGFLMNAALDHLDLDVSCVAMHDVDLVPIFFSPVPYHDCPRPTRLINKMQTYDWKIPYDHFFGAVVNLHQQHWAVINGMGNQFRGWGAEDDELYTRLVHRGLVDCQWANPATPKDKDHGTFMAISQEKEHHHARVKGPDYDRNCAIMDRHKWAGVSNSIMDGWSLNKYEVTSHTVQYTADDPLLKGFEEIHKIRVVNRIDWLPTREWKRKAMMPNVFPKMKPKKKDKERTKKKDKDETNSKKQKNTAANNNKKTPTVAASGLANKKKLVERIPATKAKQQ